MFCKYSLFFKDFPGLILCGTFITMCNKVQFLYYFFSCSQDINLTFKFRLDQIISHLINRKNSSQSLAYKFSFKFSFLLNITFRCISQEENLQKPFVFLLAFIIKLNYYLPRKGKWLLKLKSCVNTSCYIFDIYFVIENHQTQLRCS